MAHFPWLCNKLPYTFSSIQQHSAAFSSIQQHLQFQGSDPIVILFGFAEGQAHSSACDDRLLQWPGFGHWPRPDQQLQGVWVNFINELGNVLPNPGNDGLDVGKPS